MACPGAHGSRSHPRADPFHIMEGEFDGRSGVGSHGRPFVLVDLTPEGEAALVHVPQVLSDVLNAHLAGFSKSEWEALKGYLTRMAETGDALRDAG